MSGVILALSDMCLALTERLAAMSELCLSFTEPCLEPSDCVELCLEPVETAGHILDKSVF